jgi:hypothetical protein
VLIELVDCRLVPVRFRSESQISCPAPRGLKKLARVHCEHLVFSLSRFSLIIVPPIVLELVLILGICQVRVVISGSSSLSRSQLFRPLYMSLGSLAPPEGVGLLLRVELLSPSRTVSRELRISPLYSFAVALPDSATAPAGKGLASALIVVLGGDREHKRDAYDTLRL